MAKKSLVAWLSIGAVFLLAVISIVGRIDTGPQGVRGKSPALPLSQSQSPEQALAQDLALSEPRVQNLTVGRRSEVFGVRFVGDHFTEASRQCAVSDCWQVEIYNFDEDAAVVAIVNVDAREVLDVLHQPGVQPGINQRLLDLALEIALNDEQVIETLGYKPEMADMEPMESGLVGSSCDLGHLCVAPTFVVGERLLWAVVDLTDERLAGLAWTEIPTTTEGALEFTPLGCPASGIVNRDGWMLNHEVTATDGLRVYDVTFNGMEVLTSVKLAEWHADYGSTGFIDSTGCGNGGGGFPIYPYGDTQILDLYDSQNNLIGFEVVQDFRMSNWGDYCNYRYEQHIQFYNDGHFRVVGGAFGKGCSTNPTYRPLVRIDIAVDGDPGDRFYTWDGTQWNLETEEAWWLQGPPFTGEGFKWMVEDQSGGGYYIEPGQGQFGDGGRGDFAYIYTVRHHPDQGDNDLGALGPCCNDDYQQGPHIYLDNEAITDENIVLWYVPQMVTEVSPPNYYCWTLTGEPNPETYPCFGGPMFIPREMTTLAGFEHSGPADIGETVVFTNTSSGPQPLSFSWDFGDGIGTSTLVNPTYQYDQAGIFTVTLTVSSPLAIDTAMDTIPVGVFPAASFEHTNPLELEEPAVFTDTSTGSLPLSYTWDFGDGTSSTEQNPSHLFPEFGIYTVTLTVSNPLSSSTGMDQVHVGQAALAGFLHNGPVAVSETVVFTNTSTGSSLLTYDWDFGDDAGSSTEANPSYQYDQSGSYTVTLTASNPLGSSQFVDIVVVGEAAVADFSHPEKVPVNHEVVFTDKSLGAEEYLWDFGDGRGTSSDANPSYRYASSGIYEVTLTVSNIFGTSIKMSAVEVFYPVYLPLNIR